MQGSAWIEFFQRVPVQQQDNLMLLTMTGTEVLLQTIVALEEDYMIVRGRTAGSQDAGKVLMFPYSKIDYVGFQRRVMEPELQAMFGSSATAAALPTGDTKQPAPAAAAAPAGAAPAETAAPAAAEQPGKKPAQPSKSILLARLRARLGGDGKPAAK